MALTKEERLKNVWERATDRFDRCYAKQQQIRLAALEDRRFAFVDGAQWEGGLGDQFENRPRFVVNKVQKAVRRIASEYRSNAMTVNFRSGEDDARIDDMNALRTVYRSDEQYSKAQDSYVSAFDEAACGGMGAWRLTNDYDVRVETDYDDDAPQRILIEPISDADISVFFDPDSKKLDKSDAKWCTVLNPISWDTYTTEYLDGAVTIAERPSSFKQVRTLKQFDWFTNDAVYIGEYYEVEQKTEEFSVWREPHSGIEQKVYAGMDAEEREAAAEQAEEWKSIGYVKVRSGKRNRKRVRKYFLDGSGILKDCGYIAGTEIPIVVVMGIRQIIDGIERFQGSVRLAKDSQRLYNMQISTLADITAFTPREKPIFTPEQIAGHELTWANDLVANNPYLLINPITGADGSATAAGPVGYIKQPDVPPALAGLIQITAADMMDVTGGDLAAGEVVANTSDALVSRVQAHQDMQVYIFIDGMKRAMQRCGEIYLSMACDVYTEENRKFTAVNEEEKNQQETAVINVPTLDSEGRPTISKCFNRGMDVFVDVGPAFNSRKDATVNAIAKIIPGVTDPELQQLMLMTLVKNLDGEGMDDLSKYARKKLVQAGVVKPTQQEEEELEQAQAEAANQPPDAATLALIAQARESSANATKAQASAVQSLSTAELNQAKAAESVSNTNAAQLGTIMQMLAHIQERVGGQADQISQSQPKSPADAKANAAIASNVAAPSPGVNPLHGAQVVQPDPNAQQLTAGNVAAPVQAPVHQSNRPAVGK